ncbi:MAG: GntR family transcriptional regulator [Cellulosilyticaceae bacterium]
MFPIDIKSSKPLYEQIIDYIKEQALKGNLKPQDKLPSVRQLASTLGINPNTVSKAYAELERQKVIETIRGRGTFICEQTQTNVDEKRLEAIRKELKALCISLSYMGIEKEQVKKEIDAIYERLSVEEGGIQGDRD